MAKAILTKIDLFSCPVCLDLLKNPVAIPCGHSFCLDCIKGCWDQHDQTGVYSCPQCRQSFTSRPVLNKNTMLAELAERLRNTRIQTAPSTVEPGDVECDFCTGTKHKAVKSCLVCLASYCETHVQTHYKSPALKKHTLVEVSMNLKEKICPHHDKLLEAFCFTDHQCICVLCILHQHKGHTTLPVEEGRSLKQKESENMQTLLMQSVQQREKELLDLRQAVESFRCAAQEALEETEKIFTDLITSMETKRFEVKELIRAKEEAEVSLAEERQKNLEQEIADLRRRNTELEKLSHKKDHIQYLKTFQTLGNISGGGTCHSRTTTPLTSFSRSTTPQFSITFVKDIVSEMKQLFSELNSLELVKVSKDFSVEPSEAKTKEEFLPYSFQVTIPYAVPPRLQLMGNNKLTMKEVYRDPYSNHYSDNRSNMTTEVLCPQGLSKRCYWEVEICGDVSIAVTYIDLNTVGLIPQPTFGNTNQSWGLKVSGTSLTFSHNNQHENLRVVSPPSRIGVYLNHNAGILSFYSVSDTMTLLHRFQTTFTKSLYAMFRLGQSDSSVEIVK